ncbi:MAG: hypothetical protein HY879_27265, partial [Deltaproteobacteria bacterium]|nr:hypothetical protein [Deltaproteobacteria bacterium]
QAYQQAIIQAQRDYGKPFVVISIPGSETDFGADFFKAGIPFFESAERAMGTYAVIRRNQLWRQGRRKVHVSYPI